MWLDVSDRKIKFIGVFPGYKWTKKRESMAVIGDMTPPPCGEGGSFFDDRIGDSSLTFLKIKYSKALFDF